MMKVYISNYRDHWVSPYTILEKVFFWREIDYDEPIIVKWSDRLQPICLAWQKFLEFVHPRVNIVKIDNYDTWSMDYTLSKIVLPMLKQLKETKHGSAMVDDEDVPEHLRSTAPGARDGCEEWDSDKNIHLRWDWAINEMIWAFEQKIDENADDQFYDHSGVDKSLGLSDQVSQIKVDREGLDAWQTRKQNGFRLFGKYYEGLWD